MESGIAIVCLVWLQATTGTLPKARAAHSATLVDGRRMLVFGGESQDGRLKDVWALDTKVSEYESKTTWEDSETPPVPVGLFQECELGRVRRLLPAHGSVQSGMRGYDSERVL